MDDIVDVGVGGEDFVEGFLVGDVAGDVLRFLAGDEFDTAEDFLGGVVEIVDYDDFIVGLEEGEGSEGAYVARAARNN